MPSAFIDPDGPFVVIRPSDPLTLDAMEHLLDEVASLPGAEPETPRVWDLSQVDLTRVETGLVAVLASRMRERGFVAPGTRVAVVAPADLTYGMSRMYEMLRGASPIEYRVFRELQAAKAWIRGEDG